MSTPFRECPLCGAHLDHGERCDCTDHATAEREAASIDRAYGTTIIGVDLAREKALTGKTCIYRT